MKDYNLTLKNLRISHRELLFIFTRKGFFFCLRVSTSRRNDIYEQGSVCLSLACNNGWPHCRIDCVCIRAAAGTLLADEDYFGRGESIEGTVASSFSALFHDHLIWHAANKLNGLQ